MSNNSEREIAYDDGQLFRVEQVTVPGRDRPYEFVRRVGATVVLATALLDETLCVLGVENTRAYYGVSMGLPSGNAEGRFDHPEHPTRTGLRELQEETGYGYPDDTIPDTDTFLLRPISSTILYGRHLTVARNVQYIGGQEDNPRERVAVRPVPLETYMDTLFRMQNDTTYPEVNLAFAKAAQELGHPGVLEWLESGDQSPYAQAVIDSFNGWLKPVEA